MWHKDLDSIKVRIGMLFDDCDGIEQNGELKILIKEFVKSLVKAAHKNFPIRVSAIEVLEEILNIPESQLPKFDNETFRLFMGEKLFAVMRKSEMLRMGNAIFFQMKIETDL